MGKVTFQKATSNGFHRSLATWPESWVTRKIQPVKNSSNSNICFSRGLFHGSSVASLIAKTTSSQILYQTLTHSPYIKSHKNSGKWLNRITIKFHMKLKPTKKHSCKSKFYNLPIWLFRDKTLKQNLNLKGELGNRGKTYSHLLLKSVKHLDHIHLYPKTLVHNK